MRRIIYDSVNRLVPVFILLVACLAFGIFVPRLGFYWDDWAKILVSRLYGLSGYPAYYAEDRPLSAWTHMLFTTMLGASPLAWQIFTLGLRVVSAWGLWWVLSLLWPTARRAALMASLLFLVYPVFLQQSAAVTFHQQWLQYAFFFFSLGAMLRAVKAGTRKAALSWTALSLVLSLLQLTVTEYFAPLELVRPFVLWYAVWQPGERTRARAARTARAWAPYFGLLAAYTIYRLFFQQFPGEDPYRANILFAFFSDPAGTLTGLIKVMAVDTLQILVGAWGGLGKIILTRPLPAELLSYMLALAAGGLTAVYLAVLSETQAEQVTSPESWQVQALVIGMAALLLGPVPAWITGRQVLFDFHSDRYALPAMFGAALLFSALIGWLARGKVQRAVLAGWLVALAVGLHVRTANEYRWIWTDQLRTFWQLHWRAPGLADPTAIIFETEPFPNQGLFSTSAAVNLLYSQPKKNDPAHLDLDYWVYTLRPRYSHAPDSVVNGLHTQFRTLVFDGATPASLLVYKQPGNCLWVLSPQDNDHPDLPELVTAWLPVSNLNQIITNGDRAAPPPAEMFGPEEPGGWCYYFQKTALAVQMQDWQNAADLSEEAQGEGYTPDNPKSASPYEWIPFIQAEAGVGRWENAAHLTSLAYQQDRLYGPLLCSVWQKRLGNPEMGQAGAEEWQNLRGDICQASQ